ncbi:MAG TPA: aldehyde dehydrogenase family protein [Opitutaceae bacterium]
MSTRVIDVRNEVFAELGLSAEEAGAFDGTSWLAHGPLLAVTSPIDGSLLGHVRQADAADYGRVAHAAAQAFLRWRETPAPQRGELVRLLGHRFRAAKPALGRLVSLEAGKILAEGAGEVQEIIDICDFATGLSRQLHGFTFPSERPGHRIMEQWHPIGPVGCITAFNFPVAVWAWNFAVAAVCGDTVLWKPSEKTPLTAIACIKLVATVCRETGVDPAVAALVIGDASIGRKLAADPRLPVISATGSIAMGRYVAAAVAQRLGRTILELSGNNAAIVTSRADLDVAAKAIFFGAVGTAGQRCTTTRRLIVHRSVKEPFVDRLVRNYESVPIGNPLQAGILVGPLIDNAAGMRMHAALDRAREAGGKVLTGGQPVAVAECAGGCYVRPSIVDMPEQAEVVREETFAPILYVLTYETLDEAIALHNGVSQGLSSAIFTTDFQEAERFLAPGGSDCGLANVNTGTSGAEIGGAFGGEKDTGGGRESGSDAWKAYMRRVTSTLNATGDVPLAQGIKFE